MDELNVQEKAATHVSETHESLSSLLCNEERDFLIRNNGDKVKVEELEGKYVGLYFSAHWCPHFTPVLSEIYKKLSEKEDFEIVFISVDSDEESFEEYHHTMPWLALPFSDKDTREKLNQAFQVDGIRRLVVLDKEGRVITTEGVDIIREYGVEGYPFTAERLDELRAKKEDVRAAQTVESLLLSDERDFVLGQRGRKVPVAELVGKTVALYFSAHWLPPCRGFTPKLANVYDELKKSGKAFEIIFISRDKDQEAFEDYYRSMPWLALPFGDKTNDVLSGLFRVRGIPSLAVVGPDGKTVTDNARSAVSSFGAKAYPFTDAHLEGLNEIIELAEKSPKEIRYSQHEHSLLLTQRHAFRCDGCNEGGVLWSYCCKDCGYNLHLNCALKIRYSQHEHSLVLTQRRQFRCDGCNEDGVLWSYYCKDCDYNLHLNCALKEQHYLKQDKGQDTDSCN